MLIQTTLLVWGVIGAMTAGEAAFIAGNEAERGARYGDAVTAFTRCAEIDAGLRPYAEVHAAECRRRAGQAAEAAEALERIAGAKEEGAWKAMAQCRLAQIYKDAGRQADAAALFRAALGDGPFPWWLDGYARLAADNLIANPSTAKEGYAYYARLADETSYIKPRQEAAAVLVTSPYTEDRIAGVLAHMRSGDMDLAKAALHRFDTGLTLPGGAPLSAAGFESFIGTKSEAAPLDSIAEANAANPWMRAWLMYAMRKRMSLGQHGAARDACMLLVKHFAEGRDAGDALWWLGQQMEKQNRPSDALAIFTTLTTEFGTHFRADDAQYQMGWVHLRSGSKREAAAAFIEMGRSHAASRFRPQALYEAARIHEAAGNEALARQCYAEAARDAVGAYYAHRSLDRLHELEERADAGHLRVEGGRAVLRAALVEEAALAALPHEVETDPRIARVRFFAAHGLEDAEWEALAIFRTLPAMPNPEPYYRALAEAGLAHSAWDFAEMHRWGRTEDGRPTLARLRLEFPRAYWPVVERIAAETTVNPYLILAVARQESTFRPALTSRAGAAGVMQLMPGTAEWLRKVDPNIHEEHVRNLMSPVNSFRLGSYYLLRQFEKSGGNLIDTLASYNAGPGNLAKWRKQFPGKDADAFVEAIPFSETKDYVKKVLGNYAAYHSLYPEPELEINLAKR